MNGISEGETMDHEHDDDMDAEVNESPVGETDQYVVVAEDIADRDREAAEVDRLRRLRNYLQAEKEEADEG